MFKAQLINDFNYYRLFRGGVILMFLIIPFTSTPTHLFPNPWFWTFGLIALFIIVYPYLKKRGERFESMARDSMIEIDDTEIRIIDKDKKTRRISVDDLDKITVLDTYRIPGDSFKDFINEIRGKQHKNFIIVEENSKRQRFDFVIDSYYAIEQIKKVINKWTAKNILIEKI